MSIVADMVRTFLSVNIENEDLLSRLKYLQRRLDTDAAKLKMVEEENIHFTLRFFGDVTHAQLEKIQTSLESVDLDTFSIEIHGVGAFPTKRRPRVIWVGVTRNGNLMVELKSEVDKHLEKVGYQRERKPFTPHATIARVRRVYDRDGLYTQLDLLSAADIGTMTVSEFTMMKSTLTPSGAIYDTIWKRNLR